MMYCKTISESAGRHIYGIDLISFVNDEFNVLLSVEDVTDNWICICRLVRWVNIVEMPPVRFYEVLDALDERITDDDPAQNDSESPSRNKNMSEASIYRMKKKSLWGCAFKLDEKTIDRICRILGCGREELYLPEE